MTASIQREETVKRLIGLFVALMLTLGLTAGAVLAQDTGSRLSELGLPRLDITIASDGSVTVPETVAAGPVQVNVTTETEVEGQVFVFSVPEGVSQQDVEAAVSSSEEEEEAPSFIFEWTFVGGLFIAGSSTPSMVVNLTPGQWYIFVEALPAQAEDATPVLEEGATPMAELDSGEGTPVAMSLIHPVMAEAGATTAEMPVVADAVNVNMINFDFDMPSSVPAGQQVWNVTNAGDQPHHMLIMKGPRLFTDDEIMQVIMLDPGSGATPAPDASFTQEEIEQFIEIGGVEIISPGQNVLIDMDLEPGFYIALCFLPDQESGMPHAMMGMVQAFEVVADGTGGATPVVADATPEA